MEFKGIVGPWFVCEFSRFNCTPGLHLNGIPPFSNDMSIEGIELVASAGQL